MDELTHHANDARATAGVLDMKTFAAEMRALLLDDVVPFWMRHSLDPEHGGYLTCLDRDGAVYNTDKSIWMQGRQVWMLSTLYHTVEQNPAWLDAALSGARFLADHAYDRDGRMFFTVTREGRPLRKRRYVFSESFAAIAFAALSRSLGNVDPAHAGAARSRAWSTFRTMHHALSTPGVLEPKIDPSTRRIRSLAVPMILVATAQELRGTGAGEEDEQLVERVIADAVRSITGDFARPSETAVFEMISGDDQPLEGPAARTLNPGHAIEAAWFLLREARERNDAALRAQALAMLDWTLERGWDGAYGGFFAFQDSEGKPPERLEWDMKLWWPHTEALIACTMAWRDTGKEEYRVWISRILDYCRGVFMDPSFGEWFGYAHRDGTRASTLKGSLWKGMFHVPRALWWCMRLADE